MSKLAENAVINNPEEHLSRVDLICAKAATKSGPGAHLFLVEGSSHQAMKQRFEEEHLSIRTTMPKCRQKAATELVQLFLKHVYDHESLEVWDQAFTLTTDYFKAEGTPMNAQQQLCFEPEVLEAYEDACTRTAVILGQHTRLQPEVF